MNFDFHDPSAERELTPGTFWAGRYRIISMLGKGGMGIVYLSEDNKLAQHVALKFLPHAGQSSRLEQFLAEVRIARQISHPNVCRVHDIGEFHGHHYLSMEWVEGEDLGSLLERLKTITGNRALEIAHELCDGLAAAHARGVLHRDLKPANIMIDGEGHVRIMDFGLAITSGEQKETDEIAGTLVYMSPEQLEGKVLTARSDLYALGLILYEMYSGKTLLEGASMHDLVYRKAPEKVPGCSDPEVEAVILRCLRTDSEERPGSAREVADLLPGSLLQLSLAQGKTPSPQLVAAGKSMTELRPAVAWMLFGCILAGLLLITAISQKALLSERIYLELSPEALRARAGQMAADFGYGALRSEEAYWVNVDQGCLDYAITHMPGESNLTDLPVALYSFRHTTLPIAPFNRWKVEWNDPPIDVPGMWNLKLDSKGRLQKWIAIPSDTNSLANGLPKWERFFQRSALPYARFSPVAPETIPPGGFDARFGWEGPSPSLPSVPLRVEAASYRGKAVYFEVLQPWRFRTEMEAPPDKSWRLDTSAMKVDTGSLLRLIGLAFIVGSAVITGILLARRNLLQAKGDSAGARRVAAFVFCAAALSRLTSADHVPVLGYGMAMGSDALSRGLLLAAVLWILYVALEPSARRRWPELLVTWNRLLNGRFRDPDVGSDILIGMLAGMGGSMLVLLAHVQPPWKQAHAVVPFHITLDVFARFRESLYWFFTLQWNAVLAAFALFVLMVALHNLFRKQWITVPLLMLIISVARIDPSSTPWEILLGALVSVCGVMVLVRFGLLAFAVSIFVFHWIQVFPFTLDFGAWYFPRLFAFNLILVLLGLYAALTTKTQSTQRAH